MLRIAFVFSWIIHYFLLSLLIKTFFSDSGGNRTRLKFLGEPHNITVTKGGSATLECAATGYPAPVVHWKKLNGNVRVYSASDGVNNLNFTNIHESDGGKYECQASSDGNTIFRSVWLFVRGNFTIWLQICLNALVNVCQIVALGSFNSPVIIIMILFKASDRVHGCRTLQFCQTCTIMHNS